jgi:phospholipid/cholesterol/gamma-HCH transport system substrate-binding protein
VKFADASGLLKGSDVYLAGAVIGKVTSDPHYIPDSQRVEVNLKINKDVGIRTDATYEIGSSGLLGDRFVVVKPAPFDPNKTPAPFHQDGDVIDRANDIARQLDDMITRLNVDVLSSTSTDDLKETISKLRHMVDSGDSMISNANDLLVEAKTGKGVLGRLINDKQVGDNLAVFMANLKTHGPIFYHDDSTDKDSGDEPTPKKKK